MERLSAPSPLVGEGRGGGCGLSVTHPNVIPLQSGQQRLGQHAVDALVDVDHLGDPQVGGEAA